MTTFTVSIVDTAFSVTSFFASTRDYCRAYLTAEKPAYHLTVTREDMALEQQYLDAEARQEGLRLRVFSDPFLERAVIQHKIADILRPQDVLLFHGSALSLDGEGYLFTAPCGTGKSTHTRLWRQHFGSRVVMVNDDKPFLRITDHGVMVYGSPWSGKHGLDSNIAVPLRSLCLLSRGQEDRIYPLSPEQAEPFLLSQICPPAGCTDFSHCASLIHKLCIQVPLWKMEATPTESAVLTAYAAFSRPVPPVSPSPAVPSSLSPVF